MEKKTVTITDRKSQKPVIGWKEVTIGGISGIVLGGATAYAASAATSPAEEEVPEVGPETEIDTPTVAPHIDGEMSFDEAFAAARQEYGPGATFEWHGQVYGTYYATEWNVMSPQEQQEFTQQAIENNPDVVAYTTPESPAAPHATHVQAAATPETPETPETPGTTPETPSTTPETPGTTPETPGVDDGDGTQILGFEQSYNDDGTVSNAGYVSVEGTPVMVIDVDGQDGVFDYMVGDFNGNQQIDDDEIIDISGENMSVEQFAAQALEEGAPVYLADGTQIGVEPDVVQEDPAIVVGLEEPIPTCDDYDNPGNNDPYVDPADNYIASTGDLPDYMNDADPIDLA